MSSATCLQFRTNTVIKYEKFERDPLKFRFVQQQLTQNLRETPTYSGKLCPGTKKRLTRSIETLVQISQQNKRDIVRENGKVIKNFTLSFITLTIHEPRRVITGKEAHKNCLEPFLQWLRRQHGINTYLWKAEHQKRGQLHYHITCTSYIPCKEIHLKWNELCAKAGYLDEYFKVKGHYHAPSTQIKKVWKENNIAAYMKKEFVKAYQNEKSIQGKVWDCSRNLKGNDYYTVVCEADKIYYTRELYALSKAGNIKFKLTDHCTMYDFGKLSIKDFLLHRERTEYENYLQNIAAGAVKKKIKPLKHQISFAPLDPGTKTKFAVQLDIFSSS